MTRDSKRILVGIGIAITAIFAAGATLVWHVLVSPEGQPKAAYIAQNEAVLTTVPVFRNEPLGNFYSVGQKPEGLSENGPPYGAYRTWHAYRLPAGVTCREVSDYYRHELSARGWRLIGSSPGGSFFASYRKDGLLTFDCSSDGSWLLSEDYAA